jgi:hypothetical protein
VIGLLWFVLAILVSPFRSKARLEAEIATLRQELIVLQRKSRGRVRLTSEPPNSATQQTFSCFGGGGGVVAICVNKHQRSRTFDKKHDLACAHLWRSDLATLELSLEPTLEGRLCVG